MALTSLEKALLGYIGIEKVAPGTTKKALVAAVKRLPKIAAPVARTAAFTPAGRTVAGAAGIAAAYQAGLLDRPIESIQMDQPIGPFGQEIQFQAPLDIPSVVKKTKRKVSPYAKGVKAGMKALKASKFNGKKGQLSNAKKAFGTVSKTVSALVKGKKVRRTGSSGVIARAATKIPGITSIKVRK
tara:strand:+ start:822 stop:1376 length:555 start_codon:yes stop_codon:yes gene_type:complete